MRRALVMTLVALALALVAAGVACSRNGGDDAPSAAALEAELATQQADQEALVGRLDELESTVTGLATELEGRDDVARQLRGLERQLTELGGRLDDIDGRLGAEAGAREALDSELRGAIAELRAIAEDLDGSVEELRTSVGGLDGDLNLLEERFETHSH